ncbi:MAG: hypothetical protein IMZ55_09575 [Acidobacteria bacterium]|nr:hypothetical protein [Acidobacteriota bacterium]
MNDVCTRVAATVSLSPLSPERRRARPFGQLARGVSEQEAQELFEQELLCTFSDRWEW